MFGIYTAMMNFFYGHWRALISRIQKVGKFQMTEKLCVVNTLGQTQAKKS